jgi:hypothetical protein
VNFHKLFRTFIPFGKIRKVIMNNVMQLVKHNLLKLVMAILIAVGFALSGVGHAQSNSKPRSTIVAPTSGGDSGGSEEMLKSGSGWGG